MEIPNRVPWVNLTVGVLTIISPFVAVPNPYGIKLDLVVTGFIIAVVAITEMVMHARSDRMGHWPAINILAGIWLFISTTWANGNVTLVWSNIVLGVLSIVTALVALSYERMHVAHQVQPPTRTHLHT
jgi:hypothetical protein